MREHARALCSYVHLASLLCNVTNLFCMYSPGLLRLSLRMCAKCVWETCAHTDVFAHTRTRAHTHTSHVRVHAHTQHTYMYTHTHNTRTHARTHTQHTYVCMHTHNTRTCTFTHTTHLRVHAHTHTIHIRTSRKVWAFPYKRLFSYCC